LEAIRQPTEAIRQSSEAIRQSSEAIRHGWRMTAHSLAFRSSNRMGSHPITSDRMGTLAIDGYRKGGPCSLSSKEYKW